MDGYYSIDGGAVVRARVAINTDITDVWSKSLTNAREIEFKSFGQHGLYYNVIEKRLKKGQRYYTYCLDVVDSSRTLLYSVLVDLKGYLQIDIRYGAQRCENRLNTGYRELLEYLRFRVLEEKISRVDLAITVRKNPQEVIKHVIDRKYKSLLSRRFVTVIGDPDKPEYVRIGSPDNVEVAIYDKHREMLANSYKLSYKDKLEDYLDRFDGAEDVCRIEYRLFRNYLHHVDIVSPDDVNKELFSLWATMLTRYFAPTEKPYDGHNDQPVASWWLELPQLGVQLKTQGKDGKKGPIMFNRVMARLGVLDYRILKTYVSREWYGAHKTMMSRAEGYIASMAASMARVPENVDKCIQIVFRRLLKEGDIIYARAMSRFVFGGVQ